MSKPSVYEHVGDKASELAAEDYERKSTSELTTLLRNTDNPEVLRSIAERELESRGVNIREAGPVRSEPIRRPLAFRFTGSGGEYFRIWVVNVFLTIVTLGIYSAWAKVRTKRYFYGNTILDGSPFDFDAKPTAILKGRLIAVAVIAVYLVTINYYPATEPAFLLAFFVALPWLTVKAFAFRARYSSYRNVRFGFRGTYGGAAEVLIGRGLVVGLTLGLAYPWFVASRNRFLVSNTRFGTKPLSFEMALMEFYLAYFVALLLAVVIAIPSFMVLGGIAAALAAIEQPVEQATAVIIMLLNVGLFMMLYLVVIGYLKAAITNTVFRHTTIGEHGFESTLHTGKMIWLYLSNAVAIACSVGLLVPWARVRLARYRAEHLTLLAAADLDGFMAEERQRTSAAGEELSGMLDVDVGI